MKNLNVFYDYFRKCLFLWKSLIFFIYIKAFYSFDIICVRNELVYKK